MNIPYPPANPAQPASQPSASEPHPAPEENKRLPLFLWISIAALVAISVLTIITLFIEAIDYRGERITATFLLFAAFTGLTALDTFRGSARSWYGPAALVSNIWALAASLMVIWLLPGSGRYSGVFAQIVGLSILIFLIARVALLLSMWVLNRIDERTAPERGFGYLATAALVLSAAVYTGYLSVASVFGERLIMHFGLIQMDTFWDVWLKIGTAALILGALFTSITLLLRWYQGADARARQKAEFATSGGPANPYGYPPVAPQQYPAAPRNYPQQLPQHPTPPVVQQHAPVSDEPLPWPVHPDGQPYAAGPDGQPDFAAARRRDEQMRGQGNWPIS